MVSRRSGLTILLVTFFVVSAAFFFVPRIPQPLSYHDFADHRGWLGIPNFGNVVSNLPFAIFGGMGFIFLFTSSFRGKFLDDRERWPYLFFFLGLFLTAFGSGYYHAHRDNATLLGDRLPMTVAFTGLIAALISERISVAAGIRSLVPLLLIGVSSPMQWHWSELQGRGDLRFYAAVQLCAVLSLPLFLILFRPRYTRSYDLAIVTGLYVVAKLCETFDRQIFSAGRLVSGHTIKHLVASLSGYWILRMLRLREPLTQP
jgi:hypothetical protein